jgi:chemotaxis family two-component system sensor kinase Cph1
MLTETSKTVAVCDTVCRSGAATAKTLHIGFWGQVKEFFSGLFSTASWPARWHCGSWSDFHGWLYILSDLTIWAAYFAIPILLFGIVRKRKDIPFPGILWLFIAFILLCGTTHLIDAIIFWWPAYRLSAFVRFVTGIVSITTVIALYKITPMVYNLRTVDQLEAEIEERRKAEQEVLRQQLLKQSAEDLMARKDEFLSIASHELKTPITSVKAYLQLLAMMLDKNDEIGAISPFVKRAAIQVDKLADLVTDLLDVTKIQAGKLELVRTDFALADVINESIEQCRATDDKHYVTIHGDLQLIVNADRNRLEQVLCNFLTNAFKYAPNNLEVKVNIERLDNGQTKVSVTDGGVGIPDDKTGHIFDRFYRVEDTSKHTSGVGLGLYISAEIIKQHNGQIGVNSILSKGSTFWFII